MLNMYQLWLDDLFPRAKFADALAIIEKVGHTKRMQIMRKDWISEGSSSSGTGRDEDVDEDEIVSHDAPARQNTGETEGVDNREITELSEHTPEGSESAHNQRDKRAEPTAGEDPDEDELDMLLAESEQPEHAVAKTLPLRTAADDDPFADEMEAMEGMDDMW